MGKITIDELSNELKERINKLGLTEEQVQQLIDNTSGDKTQLQTNAKGSLVDAINELFQSANNGKELIATAIGEPLNSSDTFNAMSTGINNLLGAFKTNMMNNGVTVESGDKFKSLIEKLATLVDSEGKGIKYASGTRDDITCAAVSNRQTFSLNMNIDFTPTVVIANISGYLYNYKTYHCDCTVNSMFHNSTTYCYLFGGLYTEGGVPVPPTGGFMAGNVYITNSNDLSIYNYNYSSGPITLNGISWLAIGVGEEDTTLEDTLRDILRNKGIEVTPEDDLASLITKVDSIDIHQPFTGSNIIYDNGTINTELTGGLFLAKPYSGNASCTFETDYIYVYPGATSSNTSLTVNFRCRHPFSVYGYNKIKITYATRNFTVGGLKLKTEVYNWVSASNTSHSYTLSNPDSIDLNNTGGSSNITETTLNISDNTVPINIVIELKGVWNSNGPTQAGIYIHKIELLK